VEQYVREEKQILLIPIYSELHWHLLMIDFQNQEIGQFSSIPHKKYFNSSRKIINLLESMRGMPTKSFIKHFTYYQQPAQQQMDKYATFFQYFCLSFVNFFPSLSIYVHISNFLSTTLIFVQIYQSLSTLLILFCKLLPCRYDMGYLFVNIYKENHMGWGLMAVILPEQSMKAYRVKLCAKLLVEGEVIKRQIL